MLRTAICQLEITWEDKPANLEKVALRAGEAARGGARLVLFPEMTLTGFSMNTALTAETDRWSVERVAEIARSSGVAIGFGWAEAKGEKALNNYTVVDPEGNEVYEYAKIHPFSYGGEDEHFEAGAEIRCFSYGGVGISVLICYDLRFPEVFAAAGCGSELIVVPANWPAARRDHWTTLLRARAIENQAYVAGVNCTGDMGGVAYSGDSMVVAPDGRVIAELGDEEGMAFVDIDPAEARKTRERYPFRKDRKNGLYRDLLFREPDKE